MEILGVITARGGSKTIPRKNIRPLAGRPLIAYTCEAARSSRRLTRLVASTDCPDIADACRAGGIEVPFMRPPELARDDTIGVEPLVHAVEWLERQEGYRPDYVVLLQPTSPLRTADDIDAGVDMILQTEAEAVVGVTPAEVHPWWMKQADARGRMVNMVDLDRADNNRQELPAVYAVNGAIYIIRRNVLLAGRSLFPVETRMLVMPPERAMDVNTPWEMYLAGLVLEDRRRRSADNLPGSPALE